MFVRKRRDRKTEERIVIGMREKKRQRERERERESEREIDYTALCLQFFVGTLQLHQADWQEASPSLCDD